MNLLRREQVFEDLVNLSFYIAQDDMAAADRFLDACAASFERLTQMPYIGVERKFRNPRLDGVRMWFVQGFEKHLIFYRVTDDTVEIIRVLHATRDIEGTLGSDEENPV